MWRSPVASLARPGARHLSSFARLLGLAAFAGALSCTFPDITLAPEDAGSAGGSGGSTSTISGGSAGSTTSSQSTTSQSTSSSTTSSSSSSTTATCPLDSDNDGAVSWQCQGGTDCADDDFNTNPSIDTPSAMAIQGPTAPNTDPYDKNCDGTVQEETPVLNCGIGCDSSILGFQSHVDCGVTGTLGHCKAITCQWTPESPGMSKQQKCL